MRYRTLGGTGLPAVWTSDAESRAMMLLEPYRATDPQEVRR
jgi:hypothetical protein